MGDLSNINQYYNLYDATKEYTELLFRAGKVLQSKELNEMQSMLKNQIKNVGDTILTNGDIIEGCQLVIDGTNITITKGKIYLNGDVRSVPTTSIEITGEGKEVIGAILISEVITPDDDEDLKDIASGYDNYNLDGAYRLKENVQITLNNNDASILYTLVDGQQQTVIQNEDLTQLDKFEATLARRTFDESGNYKVSGLKLIDKGYNDANFIYLSLETGKAYVKGYEVNKTNAQQVALERTNTLRVVENEPKIYRTGTTRYLLNNENINSINKVVSIVQVAQTITRGSIIGGTDYLPLHPVTEIVSVKQGGTTFTQGVDYQLFNDGVDWSLGKNAPEPGSTYIVTWAYNKTMEKGLDYDLYLPEDSIAGYIEFLNNDRPVDGSTFLVNYDFKLCRRDVISIDKGGNIIVTQGQPDVLRKVESPSVDPQDSLVLGSVLLKPNSNEISIIQNNTQTIPMLDLYKMLERINALEYNQSITDLDNEAAAGENATELIGVFTDGFIGLTKADLYHDEWNASIDLDNQELVLPFETSISNLAVDRENDFKAGTFNRLLTTPYTEEQLFSQNLVTGSLRVNNYNAFPKNPAVQLSPSVDNWVDENSVTIEGNDTTKVVTLRRWWYHKGESWAQQEKAIWQSYGLADGGQSLGWNATSVTTTKSLVTSILDTAIMYMRQRNVNLIVQHLEPNIDNIMATFDGIPIELTPVKNTYRGSKIGTLKADADGKALGYFTIPANTLCGTRELKVYPEGAPYAVGSANYTANGRTRTTITTVWKETVNLNPYDPIAQSFQFDIDHYLTSVGIYFLDKEASEPIVVQVRNMVNGYPGSIIYAEKVLYSNQILTSNDGSKETRVRFDDPVYCKANEQYCFTIMSNSDLDSVWIAETTRTDITTNTQVSRNPYLNGNLFSSSNAMTWTAHQSADMKFNLYGARFELSGHAIFQAIEDVSLDRLMVVSEESIPTGCTVNWKYRINDGTWLPIETYDDRDLDEVAEKVDVRVDITANSYTSPAIALDSLILAGFSNKASGVYISKNVVVPNGFNMVKQVVDLYIPANTNVNMYYATDTDGDDWKTLNNTSTVQKTNNYKTYTFEARLGAKAYNYRCKIELSSVLKTSKPKAMNLRSIMKEV